MVDIIVVQFVGNQTYLWTKIEWKIYNIKIM